MATTEETIGALRREMTTAMEGMLSKAHEVLEKVVQQRSEVLAEVAENRTQGLSDVAEERAKALAEVEARESKLDKDKDNGLAEMAEERAKALAEVDARREELGREVAAMHKHKEAQEGRVELNIGGYRFETSVQTLRRLPHTFFDAYFSGRYAQDAYKDGSIFVDRDCQHFGHVLEYMRDGVLSVAEPGARSSVTLLRELRREFGFYCIELATEQSANFECSKTAYVVGGDSISGIVSSMERYDAHLDKWIAMAAVESGRHS
jgi:hypothetical protein